MNLIEFTNKRDGKKFMVKPSCITMLSQSSVWGEETTFIELNAKDRIEIEGDYEKIKKFIELNEITDGLRRAMWQT